MLPQYPRSLSRAVFSKALPLFSLLAILVSNGASAAVISGTATPFTGDDLRVSISIDDAADPGNLVITINVEDGSIGDLRGFFAHISDESLLSGLSVSGDGVTSSVFDANNVINLGHGSNLNGGDSPCPCDLGVEIGTSGIGKDDLQSVMFTLSHVSEDLELSLFSGLDFGIRATSVGPLGNREGSSKLGGVVVPEPSTALLMALGLGGLAAGSRRAHLG